MSQGDGVTGRVRMPAAIPDDLPVKRVKRDRRDPGRHGQAKRQRTCSAAEGGRRIPPKGWIPILSNRATEQDVLADPVGWGCHQRRRPPGLPCPERDARQHRLATVGDQGDEATSGSDGQGLVVGCIELTPGVRAIGTAAGIDRDENDDEDHAREHAV